MSLKRRLTPQLRNLQRGAVRHLGAGRPPPGPRPDRHPLQPQPPKPPLRPMAAPSRPTAGRGKTSPRPSSASTPTATVNSAARKPRCWPACRATSIGSTPTRTARSPAPSSTKRSSSATGPTRIAAFAACARQAGAARSRKGSPMNILSASRIATAVCLAIGPPARRRRRLPHASASAPGRARQPAASRRALDRSADPRSLRHG